MAPAQRTLTGEPGVTWYPPVQAILWLAAQQASAGILGRRHPGPVATTVGAALIGTAGIVGLDTLRRFVRRGTTWHPWQPESASHLVTDGPNAYSRNPMYAAMALGLVGAGLLSGRSWTAAAALGLMTTLTPQIEREEQALDTLFGAHWRAYTARVPRWFGPV